MSHSRIFSLYRIVVLAILFVSLNLFFQNCGSGYSSGQQDSSAFQNGQIISLEGNGDSYDGKLELKAPDTILPDQSVSIEVTGGTPPYELSSTSSTGQFSQVTQNQFQFQIDSGESESSIVLQVVDADGMVAVANIRVLGNNRWYFENPEEVVRGPNNSIFFIDNNKYLYQIDSLGNETMALSAENFSKDELNLVSLAYKQDSSTLKILNLESGSAEIFSWSLQTKTFETLQLNRECGRWGRIADAGRLGILVSCQVSNEIYLVETDNSISTIRIPDLSSISGARLTSLHDLGGEAIFLSFSNGQILKVTYQGGLIESFKFSGLPSSYSFDILDTAIDSQGRFYAINDELDHLLFLDSKGVKLQTRSINGVDFGGNHSPHSLDISSSGEIVVSNTQLNTLVYYESATKLSHIFGSSAYSAGSFKFPTAVEYDSEGKLYVLDSRNNRMQIFSDSGGAPRIFNSREWTGGAWWSPQSFRVKNNGNVVVANTARHIIQEININDSSVYREITGANGQDMRRPQGVEIADDGTLYVSDTNRDRILICPVNSNCRSFGEEGTGSGQFRSPGALRIYKSRLYISDQNNHRIQVFTMSGSFIEEYKFNQVGKLNYPGDLLVYGNGHIIVADTKRNRILERFVSGEERVLLQGVVAGRALSRPQGVARSKNGDLAIADTENHRIIIINKSNSGAEVVD